MKITICASLDFTYQIKEVADRLIDSGHKVNMPITSGKILKGEVSLERIKKEKNNGRFVERVKKSDAIRAYWQKIKQSEAILVLNLTKQGKKNYIGGNTFLEMGFAYVLSKRIFLFNPLPENFPYFDELQAIGGVVLKGDLTKIK